MPQEINNVDNGDNGDTAEETKEVGEPTTDEEIATKFAQDVATKAQEVTDGTMSLQDFIDQCTQRITEIEEDANEKTNGDVLGGLGADNNNIEIATKADEVN